MAGWMGRFGNLLVIKVNLNRGQEAEPPCVCWKKTVAQ
jgi:hypothetical protein